MISKVQPKIGLIPSFLHALKSSLVWLTDAEADYAYMKLEPIAANSDELFIKNVMAIGTHVRNQAFNVLYVG